MKLNAVVLTKYLKTNSNSIVTLNCYTKQKMIISGLDFIKKIYCESDENLLFNMFVREGEVVEKDQLLFSIQGELLKLVEKEDHVLNVLKQCSTLATNISEIVSKLNNYQTRILFCPSDILHKNAIINGGGILNDSMINSKLFIKNHYLILIDNLEQLIYDFRIKYGRLAQIAIEVNSLEQFKMANSLGVDVIILNNLPLDLMVICINLSKNKSIIIASEIDLNQLINYVKIGLDYIILDSIHLIKNVIDLKTEYII